MLVLRLLGFYALCLAISVPASYYTWFNVMPSDTPKSDRFGIIVKTDIVNPNMCLVQYGKGQIAIYSLEKNNDSSYRNKELLYGKAVPLDEKYVDVSIISDKQTSKVELVH